MKMKNFLLSALVCLGCGLTAFNANAAVLSAVTDPLDREIGIGNGMNGTNVGPHLTFNGDAEMRAGNNNPDYGRQDSAIILSFQLPAIPSGEVISTVSLTSDVYRHFINNANTDLYGVRSDASAQPALGDYGFGTTAGPGTLIQDNIYTPTMPQGVFTSMSTSAAGDTALTSWIDAQYTAVGAGGYAIMRLQLDAAATTGLYYKVPSGDNTTGLGLPTLSITTVPVPEPTTLGLLTLSSLALIGLRKRS